MGRIPWNKDFRSVNCKQCKTNFQTPYWKIKQNKGKFCSRKCYYKFCSREKLLICKNCKTEFNVRAGNHREKARKFCSLSCVHQFQKNQNHPSWKGRYAKECLICKKTFLLPLGRIKTRVTCSKDCYKIHLSKNFDGYKSHLWKGGLSRMPYPSEFNNYLKNFIRGRDKNNCQLCGISYTVRKLDVHHIDYDKNNIDLYNLISLCRPCHRKTNFNRKMWIRLLKRKTRNRYYGG